VNRLLWLAPLIGAFCVSSTGAAEPGIWKCEAKADRLIISCDDGSACEYVFADKTINRPFFCRVKAPGGVPVTRSHPPTPGSDPADHADMHPGIWLAFGDFCGSDFWRNKGAVVHEQFSQSPRIDGDSLTFAVENRYLDGQRTVATETCHLALIHRGEGYLVTFDSTFTGKEPLVFGDQEEMGLGVRVASPLRVTGGSGEMFDSEARHNEPQIWGKPADWCDYRGKSGDKMVGIALFSHGDNFRPSWFHVRDYGLMVANPFGRKALTGGEPSRLEIKPADHLRLRFAVWVHAGSPDEQRNIAGAYRNYLELAK
jgi:hypothetical protein